MIKLHYTFLCILVASTKRSFDLNIGINTQRVAYVLRIHSISTKYFKYRSIPPLPFAEYRIALSITNLAYKMTSTTFADFGHKTDASTVASAFASSIKGRTILVTGVNKLGIGYATAQALASQSPRRLIISGRSQAKIQECLDSLRPQYPDVDIRPLIVDLSSQKSVRKAAAEVLGWEDTPTINIVINNAGIMNIQEHTLNEDGIELHLATNHVGHFLFTNLIMPKIIAAAKEASSGATRVINVSSVGTTVSPLRVSDVNWEKPVSKLPESEKPNLAMMKAAGLPAEESMSYLPMGAYGQSKTANVLFSVGLNERLYERHGVLSLALNPGEIMTELHRTTDMKWLESAIAGREKMGMQMKTVEQGASTSLVAALDPKLGVPNADGHGQYLNDCQISGIALPYALDKGIANKLWEISEGFVKEQFSW